MLLLVCYDYFVYIVYSVVHGIVFTHSMHSIDAAYCDRCHT